MQLLNEEQSWDLLRETVYGHEAGCPGDVEDIGRTISRNCKGLPLALVVIGGLLKFNKVRDYWQEVATSTTEVAADDEHLLGIMSLSYKSLPPHLKACFLYFGMFPEDQEVPTKKLVRLWAAEGFLKPRETKTMEEVAEECLVELVERNLVMGKMKKYNGKIKTSSIHDVLRDLSLRQAQKEKLLCNHESAKMDEVSLLRIINDQRRVSFPRCNFCNISYSSLVRTFRTPEISTSTVQHFKLVRVLDKVLLSPDLIIFFRLTNLRYLHLETNWEFDVETIMVPESISKLRYLETFVIKDGYVNRYQLVFPVQIWEMPGLRHIDSQSNVLLPPFPASDLNDSSIESFSLQTLRRVVNFDFTPSVVERIQNLKTLEIKFRTKKDGQFYLGALACLMHLEKLSIHRDPDGPQVTDVAFPDKLKELILHGTRIPVENISSAIGSLPNLESLKLEEDSVLGDVWEPVDGEFLQLKHLEMTYSLLEWRAESMHFPCLEKLVIMFCSRLNEVPASIDDIDTLQELIVGESFWVHDGPRLRESVIRILEEKERCGNSLLQVTYLFQVHHENLTVRHIYSTKTSIGTITLESLKSSAQFSVEITKIPE